MKKQLILPCRIRFVLSAAAIGLATAAVAQLPSIIALPCNGKSGSDKEMCINSGATAVVLTALAVAECVVSLVGAGYAFKVTRLDAVIQNAENSAEQ